MRKIAIVATAMGLLAAPVAAQSAARDVAPVEGESELAGGGAFLGAVTVAALIAGIIIATDDDDIDLSVSA
ncbi:hypothetical protein [Alteriqipengyuania sp. 357]